MGKNRCLSLFFLLAGALALQPGCGDGAYVDVTFPDGRVVRCELADSPKKLTEGMTNYENLAPDRGMLFAYPTERRNVSFWMPGRMRFPLDMIFLDGEKRVVLIEANAQPGPSDLPEECESFGPGERGCQYVVEVVAGLSEEVGLEVGDRLEFELP